MTNITNKNKNSIEFQNNNIKTIKYLLFTIIIIIIVRYIPKKKIKTNESIIIGFISTITFAIIDMLSPSISIK